MNKSVFVFMVYLVLSLPVIFSISMSVEVRGQDNLPVVRSTDDVTIRTKINGFDGTSDEVKDALSLYVRDLPHSFSSCRLEGADSFICTTTLENFRQDGTRTEVGVQFEPGSEFESASATIYTDRVAPEISNLNVRQQSTDIVVSFRVKDILVLDVNEFPGICSGLDSVSIYIDNELERTVDVDRNCEWQEFEETIDASHLESGRAQIKIRAVDVFGNSRTRQIQHNFNFDRAVPSNIHIINARTGQNVTYIGEVSENHRVRYVVPSLVDGSRTTVTINGNEVSQSACSDLCTSGTFHITEPGQQTIVINTTTRYGVQETTTKTITVGQDTTPPEVSSVSTNLFSGDTLYLSSRARVVADFIEEQSGMHQATLYLDGREHTGSCEQARCVWEFDFSSPDGNYTGVIQASDRVGNQMDSYEVEFVRDTANPMVTDIDFEILDDTLRLRSGGQLRIFFSIDKDDIVEAYANFSLLGGNERVSASQHEPGAWSVSSGRLGDAYAEEPVLIFVRDGANRTSWTRTEEFELLQTVDMSNITYFSPSYTLSPPALEKTTSQFVAQRLFSTIHVKPKVSDVRVLDVEFTGLCQTPGGESAQVSNVFSSIDTMRGTKDDILTLIFATRAVSLRGLDGIRVECFFDISGRTSTGFIDRESHSVLIEIPFYELSVGELGDSYSDELQKAIDDAENSLGAKINSFREFWDLAEKICSLFLMLKELSDILHNVGYIFSGLAKLPVVGWFFEGPERSLCELGSGSGDVSDTAMMSIRGVCQFITCERSLSGAILGAFDVPGFDSEGAVSVQQWLGNQANNPDGYLPNPTDINLLEDRTPGGDGVNPNAGSVDDFYGFSKLSNDNLVWATANLCISGILRNLEQSRQIKCQYAVCLRDEVPAGVPKQACDEQKRYAGCQYLWGNVFGALPILSMWDFYMGQIQALFANPLALVGWGMSARCRYHCTKTRATVPIHMSCSATQLLNQIGRLSGLVSNVDDLFSSDPGLNYCDILDEGSG
ncbi:MAG: hypothetical protein ACMXYF_00445 [Candidatus Woesearchaeota archaeon]